MSPMRAMLLSLALVLVAPPIGAGATRTPGASPLAFRMPSMAADHSLHASVPHQLLRVPSPVSLTVHVGYLEQYRPSAWVPVRITLQNHTTSQLTGTLTIPDTGE